MAVARPAPIASAARLTATREAIREAGIRLPRATLSPALSQGRGGSARREEAVAGAAHGLDQVIVATGRKRLAQAPDVHVHCAVLDENVVAPHLVEDLGAPVNAVGMGHEETQ